MDEMGLFARKVDPVPEPSPELEVALDTLAAVLSTLGQHAFDVEDLDEHAIRDRFEQLGRRMLVGPGRAEAGDTQGRDYRAVRLSVREHREKEKKYVKSTITNLRDAVRECVRCVSAAVVEDRAADRVLGEQMGQLVEAFQTNDSERIKREASVIAKLVEESITRRRAREHDHLRQLSQSVQTLKDELAEARQRAEHDPLTQLFNRAALDEHVRRTTELALYGASQPYLLMADIDHFKSLNDTFGHPLGDDVLRRVADVFVRNFLRADDFVARYGGEEFAVVIADGSHDRVVARAERVRQNVEGLAIVRESRKLMTTISMGVAALQPGEEAASWIERADRALYAAKQAGRNRVQLSSSTR
jgi:diguanylate cyclase (GGDEF)-like protein